LNQDTKLSEHHQISFLEAFAVAKNFAHATMPDADFVVQNELTVERDFGWVFFYTPRRYIETQDPESIILGAGPLIVLRQDGSMQLISTSVSPTQAIEIFDEQWKKAQQK
jgi:hypothetical protein